MTFSSEVSEVVSFVHAKCFHVTMFLLSYFIKMIMRVNVIMTYQLV